MKATIKSTGLCLLIGVIACTQVVAAYPDKPIRIVTPFPAGSVTDIIARPMAARLTEAWGMAVVVDNRAGTGGNLAGDAVAKAAADGHTLLIGATGPVVVNALLYAKMPYDVHRAFAPVTLAATAGMMLVVHPSIPVNSAKDLAALAKKTPGQLTYDLRSRCGIDVQLRSKGGRYVECGSLLPLSARWRIPVR